MGGIGPQRSWSAWLGWDARKPYRGHTTAGVCAGTEEGARGSCFPVRLNLRLSIKNLEGGAKGETI